MHRRLPPHVELGELISVETLGLVDAASRFNCTRQVHFKSYVQNRIKGAMLDWLRGLDWVSRSPHRQGRKAEKAVEALTAKGRCLPSEADIAAEMGMPL